MKKKRINSNAKGKVGEREVAHLLAEYGFTARRGQQFSGGGDSPDVVHNMEGFHIEVKRMDSGFNAYNALEQAIRDKKEGNDPLVFHRRNRRDWIVVMRAEDFLRIMRDEVFTQEVPNEDAN